MASNRFERGSGAYKCQCCGRQTRSTGRGDNENVRMCAECYDLASFQNALDDGEMTADEIRDDSKKMLCAIQEKGGTVDNFADLIRTITE